MAKVTLHSFVVQGRNVFPVDMLRYDSCYPATSEDAVQIGAAIRRDRFGQSNDTRQIKLLSLVHGPTEGRWRSFGWSLVTHLKDKVDV